MPIVVPRALSHMTIRVQDMARAHAFYTRVLGFEAYFDNRGAKPLSNMLGLIGGITLELVELPKTEPRPVEASGFHCISFRVDSVDEALAALRAEGLSTLDKPYEIYGMRLVLFEDPDGNVLELIEYPMDADSLSGLRHHIAASVGRGMSA